MDYLPGSCLWRYGVPLPHAQVVVVDDAVPVSVRAIRGEVGGPQMEVLAAGGRKKGGGEEGGLGGRGGEGRGREAEDVFESEALTQSKGDGSV